MTTTETPAYSPPEGLVFTPAMRAADDAYRDQLRAQAQKDRDDLTEWTEAALARIHGRLDAWLAEGNAA